MAVPIRVARTNHMRCSLVVVWAVNTCGRRLWRAPVDNRVLWATAGGNRRLLSPDLPLLHAVQVDASGSHPVRCSLSISPSRTAWRTFPFVGRHCHETMLYHFISPRKRERHYSAAHNQLSNKSAKLAVKAPIQCSRDIPIHFRPQAGNSDEDRRTLAVIASRLWTNYSPEDMCPYAVDGSQP